MGIYQNKIDFMKIKVDITNLDKCTPKLQASIEKFNNALCVENYQDDGYTSVFEAFCTLLIQNRTELKRYTFIKLKILKVMKDFIVNTNSPLISNLLSTLSQQFAENNILELYSDEDIRSVYIFKYLDENDLVMSLATQDRLKYIHDPNLYITSEVLSFAKDVKIVLPAQKISLFYTQYKKQLLKDLINTNHQFIHIYQNVDFLTKYLVNRYFFEISNKKQVGI